MCTRFIDDMSRAVPQNPQGKKGWVLCSPAHNYNISALLKAFIDRMYCFYDFTNDRPRGYSSRPGRARPSGRDHRSPAKQPDAFSMGATMDMMRLPLQAYGYEILHELPVYGLFCAGSRSLMPRNPWKLAAQYGRDLGKTGAGKPCRHAQNKR